MADSKNSKSDLSKDYANLKMTLHRLNKQNKVAVGIIGVVGVVAVVVAIILAVRLATCKKDM